MSVNIEEKQFLKGYNPQDYDRPSVATDLVTLCIGETEESNNHRQLPKKELNILLVKRKDHPHKGKWSLAGGFIGLDETAEDTVMRVLKNKTSLELKEGVNIEQLYSFTKVNRDARMRIISLSYLALLDEKVALSNDKDVMWFNLSYSDASTINTNSNSAKDVDNDTNIDVKHNTKTVKELKTLRFTNTENNIDFEVNVEVVTNYDLVNGKSKTTINGFDNDFIAFDHSEIIVTALERLKGKVYYSELAFDLVKPLFTLKELQTVYELLLGVSLDPSAFRRRVNHMIDETEEREYSGSRKAVVYKRKSAQGY